MGPPPPSRRVGSWTIVTDPGTATYVSTLFEAVSINAVQGGSASNVVADDTVLRGNVRWFADAERERGSR